MSVGLMAKKIGMTQVYDDAGALVAVTVLQAGPCVVVQRKTQSRDGYEAVQLGFVERKPPKRVTKPMLGHFKKADTAPLKRLTEFRLDAASDAELKTGEQLAVDRFETGDRVEVTGVSKGKGFQGVMKRHGFSGGRATHGSMFHRAPGSIGQSSYPSRVFRGVRLPGQMGSQRVTTKNLTVLKIDKQRNLLLIKGSVPGANSTYLTIRKLGGN